MRKETWTRSLAVIALVATMAVFLTSCDDCPDCKDCPPRSKISYQCGGFDPVTLAYPLELLGPTADWIPQDYFDSQGAEWVSFNPETNTLDIGFRLKGKDLNRTNGEIYVDLKYLKTLNNNQPFDLTAASISFDAAFPAEFESPNPSIPNGCQAFTKDSSWRSQYGTWVDVYGTGPYNFQINPSLTPPASYTTDAGFDPSAIRIIGIKCGIGAGSSDAFSGTVSVSGIQVSPALAATPLPTLPADRPSSFLLSTSAVSLQSDGFHVAGQKWHVVGGNARLIEYGQALGKTGWFVTGNGVSKHRGFLATHFDLWRRAGVTLIRVGLIDDGRTMFDDQHLVIGYDSYFRQDLEALLGLAAQYQMKIEFVIVDYQLAGKGEVVDGVLVRGHAPVILDEAKRNSFFKNFLEPFLKEYGGCPVIFGYDVVNEPEWVLAQADGGDWESVTDLTVKPDAPLDKAAFDAFVNGCIQRIRQLAPNQFVTMGVSFPNLGLASTFDLDYLAPHWYPWMSEGANPDLAGWIATIPAGKVWMLEEFPSNDPAAVAPIYQLVKNSNGAGSLVWNLTPGTDAASAALAEEETFYQAIRSFADSL